MNDDIASFKKFMSDVRERAQKLIGETHIDLNARNALKDFIEVSRQTEKLLDARSEMSADQRVMQKRYEQLKVDHRELEKKYSKIPEMVSNELAPVLKTITGDTILISERAKGIADEKHRAEVNDATVRIKTAVRKIVEIFTKL